MKSKPIKLLTTIITIVFLLTNAIAYASPIEPRFVSGENHSHQYLVERAMIILSNDGKTLTHNYLRLYENEVKAGADWPDDYETDSLTFKGHFYHAVNHTNWLGETSPTAMTRFLYYMNLAKQQFDKDASDNSNAMFTLGKAMHYFADMNAPHHASNLTVANSNHYEWEYRADTLRNNYKAYNSPYYNAHSTNFEAYAEASADYAYSYVSDAIATIPGSQGTPDLGRWDSAAEATYEYCQQNMAAVLDAFFRSEGVQ